MIRSPTLTEHVIREAGAVAYVACLQAGKAEHRTGRLRLKRPAYDVDYAHAASEAVKEYLTTALPAIVMEARQGTDPEGLDGEAAQSGPKGIAR